MIAFVHPLSHFPEPFEEKAPAGGGARIRNLGKRGGSGGRPCAVLSDTLLTGAGSQGGKGLI